MVQMLLVTANVGSVFENMQNGLELWMNQLMNEVKSRGPSFVAIHFQETGGKFYTDGSDLINKFFSDLESRMGKLDFKTGSGYVDSQINSDEFTALSSAYFLHDSISSLVSQWDFKSQKYASTASSFKLHVGSGLTGAYTKVKFPQEFIPNTRFKKGFLRTRWRINDVELDLVNIHLFHDACNLVASTHFPSPFAQTRLRALNYTLEKLGQIHGSGCGNIPMFLFGDLNFRLNTQSVMQRLRKEESKNGRNPIEFETKKFQIDDHDARFRDFKWIKEYDYEGKRVKQLKEFDLDFHPSYPFDEEYGEKYMRTRVPAWCDRVLFNEEALKSVISLEEPIKYNLIGSNILMGDHKPVFLQFALRMSKNEDNTALLESYGEEEILKGGLLPTKESREGGGGEDGPPTKCKCTGLLKFIRDNLRRKQGTKKKGRNSKGKREESLDEKNSILDFQSNNANAQKVYF